MNNHGIRGLTDNRTDGRIVAEEQPSIHIPRKDIARNANRDRTLVLRERRFDVTEVRRNQEPQSKGSALPRRQALHGCRIPLLNTFPVRARKAGRMHHPIVGTFKGGPPRSRIIAGQTLACSTVTMIKNWFPFFKRSMSIRHNQQHRPKSSEPDHLNITRIFADVGIVKGAGSIRLVQREPIHDVVEHHRNPNAANLQWHASPVRHSEVQHEIAPFDRPGSNEIQRRVGGRLDVTSSVMLFSSAPRTLASSR